MGVENRSLARRLMAFITAACALGSLAVTHVAHAAEPVIGDDGCAVVDTAKDKDFFKTSSNGTGTVVTGFADALKAQHYQCYDLNISADVTEIGHSAFESEPIHKLTFSDEGDVSLHLRDFSFAGVTGGLEEVIFPARFRSCEQESITSRCDALQFSGISTLKRMKFSPQSDITVLGKLFENFAYLRSVELTQLVLPPKLEIWSPGAFGVKAGGIEWPNNSNSLSIIDPMFEGVLKYEGDLAFPDNLTNISFSSGLFSEDSRFDSISFPRKMDKLAIDKQSLPLSCDSAAVVTLPASVNTLIVEKGGFCCFRGLGCWCW
ncbi:leucine-rich repeat protein [Bifidobacterium miconisargentati]|uniref:leucine-rich repeat protein n=1 Tax=Bifidobacterium miconisargentati TaxID=2834437 RepID=UPI001BDBD5DC|nr:leucine-rich repeat protein [Bifidobacterium miconisargentati]MBW3091342.1 leucine-rich repeat protein [Bifidobacterium miconisargentati]